MASNGTSLPLDSNNEVNWESSRYLSAMMDAKCLFRTGFVSFCGVARRDVFVDVLGDLEYRCRADGGVGAAHGHPLCFRSYSDPPIGEHQAGSCFGARGADDAVGILLAFLTSWVGR